MSEPVLIVTVEELNPQGLGVAVVNGRQLMVPGTLPGERVKVRLRGGRRRCQVGELVEILTPAPRRTEPRCPHFDLCSGCTLQHMTRAAQLDLKERRLCALLWQYGCLQPQSWLPPLALDPWGYRRRARLSVRYVEKKHRVLVGYREVGGQFVADLRQCLTLHPSIGERIDRLGDVLGQLEARRQIPQIEVAVGDADAAIVVRHLVPLSDGDKARLLDFAELQSLQLYLQPGGPDTLTPLWPAEAKPLNYRLTDWGLELQFMPGDFVQVNGAVNQSLISLAVTLLEPQKHERLLDMYCGLGNFTLPLAGLVDEIIGLEGSAPLVQRAQENARRNGIPNARFQQVDLGLADECRAWLQRRWNKLLLDPPRSGCLSVLQAPGIEHLTRILYVSCNFATLARDAQLLVSQKGFRLARVGVVDMFPHTDHAEAVALFESR
ncbi:MAG: 23S rRNA (uracil(1939)-C(5))-methyltransferase RlmD [Gammaproteobacteria bacterium]